MYTVKHLLQLKGGEIYTIAPDAGLYQALQLMADKNVGALLVTQDDKLVGIFTERDCVRKIIRQGKLSTNNIVADLMTSEVRCVAPETSIEDCMQLMTGKRHRHLPVLENGKLIGIISIGDVVKAIISDREATIRTLETYITGGHTSA